MVGVRRFGEVDAGERKSIGTYVDAGGGHDGRSPDPVGGMIGEVRGRRWIYQAQG